MPIDDTRDGSVLELRGIVPPDRLDDPGPDGGFELLRVHEWSGHEVRRLRPADATTLQARLTDEGGHPLAEGWVVPASTTFEDRPGSALFGPAPALVRVLLALPPDRDRAHDGPPFVAELLRDGRVVWRAPVAPARPRVEVEVETVDEGIHVQWRTESDASVDILLRQVDSPVRRRVATRVEGHSVVVPREDLPGGPAVVVVRAVSRLREGTGRSAALDLPARPGRLQVLLEREQAPAGQPVTASALLTDAWGTTSSAAHAQWYVDDVDAGAGAVAVLAPDAGPHRVRVESPDAEPAEAVLTITQPGTD